MWCWCQVQVWVLFPKLTGSWFLLSTGPLTPMPSLVPFVYFREGEQVPPQDVVAGVPGVDGATVGNHTSPACLLGHPWAVDPL